VKKNETCNIQRYEVSVFKIIVVYIINVRTRLSINDNIFIIYSYKIWDYINYLNEIKRLGLVCL
jgi:hypothetical protein